MDATMRLHPNDFAIARRQLHRRAGKILSDKGDKGIVFHFWFDWRILPDSNARPILTNSTQEASKMAET